MENGILKFHDFSRPGKWDFKIPWLFQDIHGSGNPGYTTLLLLIAPNKNTQRENYMRVREREAEIQMD